MGQVGRVCLGASGGDCGWAVLELVLGEGDAGGIDTTGGGYVAGHLELGHGGVYLHLFHTTAFEPQHYFH